MNRDAFAKIDKVNDRIKGTIYLAYVLVALKVKLPADYSGKEVSNFVARVTCKIGS